MILLTFFLLRTPPATAVPPSAAISATMATTIAGEGRRKTLFILPPCSAGRDTPRRVVEALPVRYAPRWRILYQLPDVVNPVGTGPAKPSGRAMLRPVRSATVKLSPTRTGRPRLTSLGCEQPPVVRLPALMQLELDAIGRESLELAERDRRALSRDDREDLSPLGEPGHGLAQGRSGGAPGDDLVVHEADHVAGHEAPVGVVARCGCHRAGSDPVERGGDPLLVLVD